MKNLKVKNIIIGKQVDDCDNFKIFRKIVSDKKIKVIVMKKGDRLFIENNLYIDCIWPDPQKNIQENKLNNNSFVFKLSYNRISILFTGDIEEIAERKILSEYNNSTILNANILKVAHHGSKSSSILEFLKNVKSQIALIGVGEDNKFGHPNSDVIKRLKACGNAIYRTDYQGEISIQIDEKGNIDMKAFK